MTTETFAGFTPDLDAAADRIRDLNEKLLTATKQSGNLSLDAYERSLSSLLDFQKQVAGATQVEWLSAIAKANAEFVTEFSGAFTSAARQALK